jgi:Beta-galactosidase/beta-glucuronidase
MSNVLDHQEWKPVEGHIMTRWAAEVSLENALPEYPRPQMVRDIWMNLNGLWDYAVVPKEQSSIQKYEGKILVPYPLESALSGVKRQLKPSEKLWYRRTFTIPEEWCGNKLLLHFGAVDWEAAVYINGVKIGEHTGGYYPFTFEISKLLHEGTNEIVVSVWDPTDEFGQERGKQVLNPKDLFYTPTSGIWQTVWLEPVPETYIESFKMVPDIDNGELRIEFCINGDSERLKVEAAAYDGETEVSKIQGGTGSPFVMKITSAKLWSPDSPFIYGLKILLTDGEKAVDEITSYFAMRKFGTMKDNNGYTRVCLNNKPIFQTGLLDQGFWPDGLYTAPTDEALRYDIETAKKMGFNMLRKHIKVEPARWYYYCDILGMLVWQDMPNGGRGFSLMGDAFLPMCGVTKKDTTESFHTKSGRGAKESRDNYKKELKEMIDALYNVPCIMTWVPFNENWGQFDALDTAAWVKEYDSSRLIDHASGWYDQGGGDFKSLHIYFRKLSLPKRCDDRAVVISEFGGYGMKEEEHIWIEDRKVSYKGFKTEQEFAAAYKSLFEAQVMPLILRGLCAAVYTQITDVETEINGLLSYDREVVKIDCNDVHGLNEQLKKVAI